MDKIYEGERDKNEKEDWEAEREAEKPYKAERERHERESGNVGVASVNDLFKGWVDDDDGY